MFPTGMGAPALLVWVRIGVTVPWPPLSSGDLFTTYTVLPSGVIASCQGFDAPTWIAGPALPVRVLIGVTVP
jgi:hypothetical protein